MKEWRTISKDKYIIAGIITLLIFSLGLTLGIVLENHRYGIVEDINKQQDLKYSSLQLQYLYLSSFNNKNSCPLLQATLKGAIRDLSDSLGDVIAYEEEENPTSTKAIFIQRRYVLDNLRYWLLAAQSRQECDLAIVPIVYFYTDDCGSCPNQGTILSHFKGIFGDQLLVFPINLDLREQEPMVEVMMKQFNITHVPSLVIDDVKHEGVVKSDELEKAICELIPSHEACGA